jgi:membrane protein required for colicin V production
MNYLEIVILIPLLWGAYKGFSKGIIIEVSSIVGLFLGIYLAAKFSDDLEIFLSKLDLFSVHLLPFISFCLMFLGVVVLVFVLAKLLEKVINIIALKLFNKIFGAIFGMVKYALIISGIIFIMQEINSKFDFYNEQKANESILYKNIQPIIPTLIPIIKELDLSEKSLEEINL